MKYSVCYYTPDGNRHVDSGIEADSYKADGAFIDFWCARQWRPGDISPEYDVTISYAIDSVAWIKREREA